MSTHQMYQVQALCDRIVLIDHGRSVLYGRVEEIRRDFAANAVVLEGEGDFSGLPQVLDARQEDGGWHLSLEAEADPQEVLRALATRPGIRLERFERAEPSLDDIFVTVVTDGRRTGAAQADEGAAQTHSGAAQAGRAPYTHRRRHSIEKPRLHHGGDRCRPAGRGHL